MKNKNRIKINILMVFIFFSIVYFSIYQFGFSEEKTPVIDWKSLNKSWDVYIEYPSSENLKKVFILLPYLKWKYYNDQLSKIFYGSDIVLKKMVKDIWLLEKEAYSGNGWAVKVLHKLATILDGWDKKEVLSILGNLIRINPALFLEEIAQQMENIDNEDFNSILRYLDLVYYTDKIKAQYREIDLRIKSLETVKKESLNLVKAKCIEVLMERKNGYEKILGLNKKSK